jgi:hypothetical protein
MPGTPELNHNLKIDISVLVFAGQYLHAVGGVLKVRVGVGGRE